jgi:cellulose synthase/poly-beta-1,6-N-acetylglucosamine synthase-like glycosyltransferase
MSAENSRLNSSSVVPGAIVPEPPRDLVPLATPPTFSVVIPVYQGAHMVGEAIESILAQTVAPCEIIVCDDGSTDDLAGALARYSGRIILLHQDHKGVAAARNLGLYHASGDFVTVADADDRQLPRLIEALGELAMARPDLDILTSAEYLRRDRVSTRSILSPTSGRMQISHIPTAPNFPVDDQRVGILLGNFLTGHAAARSRRLIEIGGYDETLRCAEDYDVWVRLIFAGARAGLVLEPLAVKRLRPDSVSTNQDWCVQGRITTLTKLVDRGGLSVAEREVAEERIAFYHQDLKRATVVADAKLALKAGHPDARRRSLRVVVGKDQRWPTRVMAGIALLAPRWAARRLTA